RELAAARSVQAHDDVLQADARELAHPARVRLGAGELHERGHGLDQRQSERLEPRVAVAGRAGARVALAAGTDNQTLGLERASVREAHEPRIAAPLENAGVSVTRDAHARAARPALERVAHIARALACGEDLLEGRF